MFDGDKWGRRFWQTEASSRTDAIDEYERDASPTGQGNFRFKNHLIVMLMMGHLQHNNSTKPFFVIEPRAAAAVGQSGLMSLYDAMFSQYGVKIAQVLVTKPDFYNEETRRHLASTVSELISLNIVPIINTNDAVSPPPLADEDLAGVGHIQF